MDDHCLPDCKKPTAPSIRHLRKRPESDCWSDVSSTSTLVDDPNTSQWSLRSIFQKLFSKSSLLLPLGSCLDCKARANIKAAVDALKEAVTVAVQTENIPFLRGQYFNCRGVCGLLHLYGLQTASKWDEEFVSRQCEILSSYSRYVALMLYLCMSINIFYRHESSSVRTAAIYGIYDIALRCPRLCAYFNRAELLLSVEKSSDDLNYIVTSGERIWIDDEEHDILQRHAAQVASFELELSWKAIIAFRSTLLPLLLDMLCSQSM